MISSIFMSGRLGAPLDSQTRYVEVDRLIPVGGKFITDYFPVRSQTHEASPFMKQPAGAYICFKGRVERDPELGIVFVIEVDEMYRFPEGTKRI